MMRLRHLLALILLLTLSLTSSALLAQEGDPMNQDTDGDGIADAFDACPDQAGLPENYGCPEGVAPPDRDGDTVPDIFDPCPDQAGDPMFSGCPDSDGDGVPDHVDDCPNEFGVIQNNGCPLDPIPTEGDRDGDLIPDEQDACPDQPGDARNRGCPDDIIPPDSDGDGIPDIDDACPNEFGTHFTGCPDRDGDFVIDLEDLCPDTHGLYELAGCPEPQQSAEVPAERATLSADNIANASPTRLIVNVPNAVMIGSEGWLVVPSYAYGTLVYNLNDLPSLNPAGWTPITPMQSALNMTGNLYVAATVNYEAQTIELTLVENSPASDARYLSIPLTDFFFTNDLSLSPDGTLLAMAFGEAGYYGPEIAGPTILYDTASGAEVRRIESNNASIRVAFSPDGALLAITTPNSIRLYDVASGAEVASVEAEVEPYTPQAMSFSPDGALLAVGVPQGLLVVDVPTLSNPRNFTFSPRESRWYDSAMSIAFSPDGALLAAGFGLLVDGGIPPAYAARVQVFDMNSGGTVATLENGFGYVLGLAFSPDGTLLFSSGTGILNAWSVSP